MNQENEKYHKVVKMLKSSEPHLKSTSEIEREVMRRIRTKNRLISSVQESVEFLFSWIYIGWVRRSLIMISLALVLVFVYQQGTILRRIDMLSRQVVIKNRANSISSQDEIEKLLTIYNRAGKKFPSKSIDFSDQQMIELIESVNELLIKHRDLENLIENDPELKKMIEQKLIENNSVKINL